MREYVVRTCYSIENPDLSFKPPFDVAAVCQHGVNSPPLPRCAACLFSNPLHEAIHHALLAGLVELDGQLVAVDGDDVAVAEFLVEDAVAG